MALDSRRQILLAAPSRVSAPAHVVVYGAGGVSAGGDAGDAAGVADVGIVEAAANASMEVPRQRLRSWRGEGER